MKIASGICCSTILSLVYLGNLQAQPDDLSLSKCTKEELIAFFPQQVVQSVLIKAKVPSDEAAAIAKELSQKDRELGKIVEDKAAKLEQNPFKDLSQRDLALKIYNETLYEVFAKVLKAHGIQNEDQIQSLLDEIRAAKSKLFIDCIRKQTTRSHEADLPLSTPDTP